MSDSFEETATHAVVRSFEKTPDARLEEILTSLTQHLHGFVRDVELSTDEWDFAISYLTEVGHACTDTRQEFVLLSDVLGVSMLVDAINHRGDSHTTESTVLGPFHMVESPVRQLGDDIALAGDAPRCVVRGTVRSIVDDAPLAGATVDVWQADDEGFYDVQKPGELPDRNLRGLFRTNESGEFWFRSVLPRHYPIPSDGPVGALLAATNRHPNRPAHIHFIADAPGHLSVTTHLFLADSPYLGDDTVFGVKPSLIRPAVTIDDADQARLYGVENPFTAVTFDIVLDRTATASNLGVEA